VSAALLLIVACCSDVALGRVTSIPHRGALYDGLAMRALNHHNIPAVSADAPEQWFTQVGAHLPASRSMHRCAVPRKPSQATSL
jgi:hypothetical protein